MSFFSDLFGGSNPGTGEFNTGINVATPAYSLGGSGSSTNYGSLSSVDLKALGSPAQQAFGSRFGRFLTDIDTLRSRVAPTFSEGLNAALGTLKRAQSERIGSLRSEQARRRITGSSFATAELDRAASEFANAEAQTRANASFQEVEATKNLLDFEFTSLMKALTKDLSELQIAQGLGPIIAQIGTQNQQFLTGLAAQSAASATSSLGALLGTAAGTGTSIYNTGQIVDAIKASGAGGARGGILPASGSYQPLGAYSFGSGVNF